MLCAKFRTLAIVQQIIGHVGSLRAGEYGKLSEISDLRYSCQLNDLQGQLKVTRKNRSCMV